MIVKCPHTVSFGTEPKCLRIYGNDRCSARRLKSDREKVSEHHNNIAKEWVSLFVKCGVVWYGKHHIM